MEVTSPPLLALHFTAGTAQIFRGGQSEDEPTPAPKTNPWLFLWRGRKGGSGVCWSRRAAVGRAQLLAKGERYWTLAASAGTGGGPGGTGGALRSTGEHWRAFGKLPDGKFG